MTLDEQEEYDSLLEQISMLEDDIQDLQDELSQIEDPETISPNRIAEIITFENSHEVGYHLIHTDMSVARALYNELQYWMQHQ